MKIYTKTGDAGITQLFSGERVAKNSLRVELYGTIDELQSVLIIALNFDVPTQIQSDLEVLVAELHTLAADFATTAVAELHTLDTDFATTSANNKSKKSKKIIRIGEENILRLEQKIDEYFASLPKLKEFVLMYKTKCAAFLNNARTICRRAERLAIAINNTSLNLNNTSSMNNTSLNLNTLSNIENSIISTTTDTTEKLSPESTKYLNRLSDYLFAAALYADFVL